MKSTDANDFIYQYDASRILTLRTTSRRSKFRRVLLINPQEDFGIPAELGIAEEQIKRVKNGKFVLLLFPSTRQLHIFSGGGAGRNISRNLCGVRERQLTRCGKTTKRCHSERSEESLLLSLLTLRSKRDSSLRSE